MQTASSAMPTCLRLRSTVECTATVRMPSVWQARSTRNAISPRLALNTLSSMGAMSRDVEGEGFGEEGDRKSEMGGAALRRLSDFPLSPREWATDFPFPASSDYKQRLVELDRL